MECIKDFFKEWSTAIQAVSVIVLVIITFWYAKRTHLMAKIMGREYALKTRPYLKLENTIDRFFNTLPNPTEIQLQFHLQNVCTIATGYKVRQVILNNSNITSLPANVFLFPGQSVLYTTKHFISNSIIINNGDGLQGVIEIELWNDEIPERKYLFYRKFSLAPHTTMITEEEKFELIK